MALAMEAGCAGFRFPQCVHDRGNVAALRAVSGTLDAARVSMGACRNAAVHVLKKTAAAARKGSKGDALWAWIASVVRSNDALATLPQDEYKRGVGNSGVAALCASEPFLLGLTSSMVALCDCDRLEKDLNQMGSSAFDAAYFGTRGRLGVACDERRLLRPDRSVSGDDDGGSDTFSGR